MPKINASAIRSLPNVFFMFLPSMSTEEMCNRYASYSLKDFRISGLKIGTFGRQSTYFVQECLRSDTAQLAGLFFLFELNLLTSDLWSLASGPRTPHLSTSESTRKSIKKRG